MIVAVADTQTALWLLFDDKRLSTSAGDFIEKSAAQRRGIAVSAITIAEVVYLVEKGRVQANAYQVLKDALADPEHFLTAAPFTVEIAESLRKIARTAVPDIPDHINSTTGARPMNPGPLRRMWCSQVASVFSRSRPWRSQHPLQLSILWKRRAIRY